jgi:hypothetical protein
VVAFPGFHVQLFFLVHHLVLERHVTVIINSKACQSFLNQVLLNYFLVLKLVLLIDNLLPLHITLALNNL